MKGQKGHGELLASTYSRRFGGLAEYRRRVWRELVDHYFGELFDYDDAVLDLGCGWGELVNSIHVRRRLAMDLNADTARHLAEGVEFLQQDCSEPWPLSDGSLDAVFTSNFLEHLPSKAAVEQTLAQTLRCLRPGGRLICLGPNMRLLDGRYWDFWDHHVALTDRSLVEILEILGFSIERLLPRFLPYTMSDGWRPPILLLRLYLRLSIAWRVFGRQFLVVARKEPT